VGFVVGGRLPGERAFVFTIPRGNGEKLIINIQLCYTRSAVSSTETMRAEYIGGQGDNQGSELKGEELIRPWRSENVSVYSGSKSVTEAVGAHGIGDLVR